MLREIDFHTIHDLATLQFLHQIFTTPECCSFDRTEQVWVDSLTSWFREQSIARYVLNHKILYKFENTEDDFLGCFKSAIEKRKADVLPSIRYMYPKKGSHITKEQSFKLSILVFLCKKIDSNFQNFPVCWKALKICINFFYITAAASRGH